MTVVLPEQALQAERDRAIASAHTALRHATRLSRVLTVLAEPASLPTLVDRVLSTLSELFRADVVSLLMRDDTGRLCHLAALGIPEDEAPPGQAVRDQVAEQVARTASPVRTTDTDSPRLPSGLPGAQSGLWLPVRGHEAEPLGVLRLFRCRPERFTEDDVGLLTSITFRIALTVEQARLHAATQEQASTMAELYEIAKTMTETFDFDRVFGLIAKAALARLDAFEMSLLRFEPHAVVVVRSDGDGRHPSEAARFEQVPRHLLRRLERDGVVVVGDLAAAPGLRALATDHARALMVAAHRTDGVLTTGLAVVSDRPLSFPPADRAFLCGLADITALALRNARLYEQARHAAERDSLTGLRNRRVFWDDLRGALRRTAPDEPIALAVLDVDDFKQVNDRHGHATGDRVLCHVADRLQRSLRAGDQVYRVGGEEFAALLPSCEPETALGVLMRAVEAVGRARDPLPRVTISVGVATAVRPDVPPDALFRAADDALYRAKRDGKDRALLAPDVALREPAP